MRIKNKKLHESHNDNFIGIINTNVLSSCGLYCQGFSNDYVNFRMAKLFKKTLGEIQFCIRRSRKTTVNPRE